MVCSVIDECRCYSYSDVSNPKKYQFCGVRRGAKILPCPEDDCCAGGCPGQTKGVEPREPFRIIERPVKYTEFEDLKNRIYIFLIMLLIYFVLLYVL